MKCLHSLMIGLTVASITMFAQAPTPSQSDASPAAGQAEMGTRTYTGTIVDANCSQASQLTAPPSGAAKTPIATAKRDILRNCQPAASTTSFALLTDDGNFYKLDDTGNSQVTSQLMPGTTAATPAGKKKGPAKNMRASITGTVQGDMLKVQSISKM
jgi:hypothetical protein